MSSLDMSPRSTATTANKQIRASTGGTVIRYSSCQLEVVHSSGWSTNYYHLSNIQVADGATVTKGQYIALPASTESQALCEGGSWTGPHVHWTLYNTNGIENSLNGVTVSNYLMTITGTSAYGTNCTNNYLTRNGTKYCFGTRIVK
jgi:LasA protease